MQLGIRAKYPKDVEAETPNAVLARGADADVMLASGLLVLIRTSSFLILAKSPAEQLQRESEGQ